MGSAVLSRIKHDHAWILSSIHDPWHMNASFMTGVSASLTQYLAHSTPPISIDKVFGPDKFAETFVKAHVDLLRSQGMHATAHPIFTCQTSFVTKASLTAPLAVAPPASYRMQIGLLADLEVLAQMYCDFGTDVGDVVNLEGCREEMRRWLEAGGIWVCRANDRIVGYCTIGRSTPRTIAIQNVYVAPGNRKKGIAETMVRFLTRYFLGVKFEGAPDEVPRQGVKEEMCLNVIEEGVKRLYKRCGFLLGDDDVDPLTGKKGSLAMSYWSVKIDH